MPWTIYVVELRPGAGAGKRPNVYVGHTALTPKQRFQVHKGGGPRSNYKVKTYGVRIMRTKKVNVQNRAGAVRAEKSMRTQLMREGYRVWGGTRGIDRGLRKKP